MWTLLCLLATGAALAQSMSRTERASVKALYTKYIVFPKCCNNNDGHCSCTEQSTKKPGSSTDQTTKKPAPGSCSQEINSVGSKNGTFTSPNYPDPYPSNVYCAYKFVGKAKERVQISFTDFDLHLPHEPPRDCEAVDAVMIFITIDNRRERLDNFCGNKLPAQLMSNGPTMEVEFRSFHSSPEVKGFRAIYRFVTDFGISTVSQDPSQECRFVFRSEERGNGTFSSPNYPGFYPRDTECHYTFRGRDKERVHITFAYFDVDGIPPCLMETASDYVEFSNYKTVDRKLARHCGNQKPKLIESDADFFRVIFKSNDKFDATGFEAFYQFRTQIDPFTVKRVSNIPKDRKSGGETQRMNFSVSVFFVTFLMLL